MGVCIDLVTSWEPKRLENCGLCELASSGKSVKVTVEDHTYYISKLDLEALLNGKRENARVSELVEVEAPDTEPGDPHGPLTPEVALKIRHEVAEINREPP